VKFLVKEDKTYHVRYKVINHIYFNKNYLFSITSILEIQGTNYMSILLKLLKFMSFLNWMCYIILHS